MLATPGELPAPEQEQRWAFEMKWDGIRAVVYLDGGGLRLMTRNDREVAATYPELAGAGRRAGRPPGGAGRRGGGLRRGRPAQLRRAAGPDARPRPGRALLDRVPVSLLVFDVLHLDGTSLLGRRTTSAGPRSRTWTWRATGGRSRRPSTGRRADALEASRAQGLEGVLAKRHDSTYLPGRRSPHWVKVKHSGCRRWSSAAGRPGAGRREGGIGSLLLGVPDDDGTAGVRRARGHRVHRVGAGRPRAPAAGRWSGRPRRSPTRCRGRTPRTRTGSRPRLVGEVRFSEWTRDGRMRHPTWRGLRPDKEPEEVRRES